MICIKGDDLLSNEKFETLKEKYEQGYRCIRTENENNGITIYLKNFYTEQIDTLTSNNNEEIYQMNQYISSMTDL